MLEATQRFFDDFHGAQVVPLTASNAGGPWCKADTSAAGAPTLQGVSSLSGGVMKGLLAADAEVENLCLYWGDILSLKWDDIKQFACRFAVGVTLDDASDIVVWGLGSARADAPDDVTYNAWFRAEADMDLLVETDDNSTNDDDNDTTINLASATFKEYVIDFSNGLSDVRFFATDANGKLARVLAGTTFSLAGATGQYCQPIFQISKAANADQHYFLLDWVDITYKRS